MAYNGNVWRWNPVYSYFLLSSGNRRMTINRVLQTLFLLLWVVCYLSGDAEVPTVLASSPPWIYLPSLHPFRYQASCCQLLPSLLRWIPFLIPLRGHSETLLGPMIYQAALPILDTMLRQSWDSASLAINDRFLAFDGKDLMLQVREFRPVSHHQRNSRQTTHWCLVWEIDHRCGKLKAEQMRKASSKMVEGKMGAMWLCYMSG